MCSGGPVDTATIADHQGIGNEAPPPSTHPSGARALRPHPEVERIASKLLLLTVSLLVTLASFECGLRFTRYGSLWRLSGEHTLRTWHPVRGWALEPSREAFQRSADYAVHVRTNAHGLRDRPHEVEPAPGVFRIVVLGDSFMEAYQVPLEASLPYRLQEMLSDRRVEVINLGVGGYGTAQQFLALRDDGLRYRPDLVVLALFSNDVINNSRALEERLWDRDELKVFGRPYARAESLDAELEWTLPDAERVRAYVEARATARKGSRWKRIRRFLEPALVGNLAEQAFAGLGERFAGAPRYDPNIQFGWPFLREFAPSHPAAAESGERYRALWEEAWLTTRRLILETERLSAAAGARFAVMSVPTLFQVDRAYLATLEARHPDLAFDTARISRALAGFCASEEIPFLDLTAPFSRVIESRSGVLYHRREDFHWNSAGHELATRELAHFLDDAGLMPPP